VRFLITYRCGCREDRESDSKRCPVHGASTFRKVVASERALEVAFGPKGDGPEVVLLPDGGLFYPGLGETR
jgi:hypothetical protein